jgi:pyruvate dehydrogenase E2 component (dihydrolipoamide acetyltransferase)
MPIPITIPRLGWNMDEGIFVEWLKFDGDEVKPGDRIYRLEGEKSVEEIESFDAGILSISKDAPKPGAAVKVGDVIGYLRQAGESPISRDPKGSEALAAPAPRAALPAISPRARRLAQERGIDWEQIPGSGKTGRIRERDIPVSALTRRAGDRSAIAARMMASHHSTAPVTLTSLVDASNLVNLRNQFKSTDGAAAPSFTDFIVKLAACAIAKHSHLAARWTDSGIVPPSRIDIGIAVDTDAGLVVPVIRDVPALGLRDIAIQSRELIERARGGHLAARDMEGGCFTITNLGAFGIEAFTPIINYPECAILGVGCIERRPVMEGDRVVGREQVTLSLTFDHRVVDGAPAARFLQTLGRMIANPAPWITP